MIIPPDPQTCFLQPFYLGSSSAVHFWSAKRKSETTSINQITPLKAKPSTNQDKVRCTPMLYVVHIINKWRTYFISDLLVLVCWPTSLGLRGLESHLTGSLIHLQNNLSKLIYNKMFKNICPCSFWQDGYCGSTSWMRKVIILTPVQLPP